MVRAKQHFHLFWGLCLSGLLLFLLLAGVGRSAEAAAPALVNPTPGRPTAIPTPTPAPSLCTPTLPAAPASLRGAAIWLRVRPADPASQGQDLWTVVQWQDALGEWHDVEGWRGVVDDLVNGEGRKVWWLPSSLFGKGPFRWLVYVRPGGAFVGQSAPFYLPHNIDDILRVEVIY